MQQIKGGEGIGLHISHQVTVRDSYGLVNGMQQLGLNRCQGVMSHNQNGRGEAQFSYRPTCIYH